MIDFYYWGTQCPYNYSNMEILKKIEADFSVEINYFDLSDNHNIALEMNLYSPTMTIFDKQLRWSGPITYDLVERYLRGDKLKRTPYIVKSKNQRVDGELVLFTPNKSTDIEKLCCQKNCKESSKEKGIWLNDICNKYNTKHLGVLHYLDGDCVGGVEYVPSLEVPYDIPKSKDIAFLTCIFASNPIFDYKSYPLERLEFELKKEGYNKVYAIASKEVAFPNGPLDWFIDQGYSDLGLVYYEENDDAYQHLVEKSI